MGAERRLVLILPSCGDFGVLGSRAVVLDGLRRGTPVMDNRVCRYGQPMSGQPTYPDVRVTDRSGMAIQVQLL